MKRLLDAQNQVIEAALALQFVRMYKLSHPYDRGPDVDVDSREEYLDVAVGRYAAERQRETLLAARLEGIERAG